MHLLFYIFADDETGQKVIGALARAVDREVVCRVLIDALGSRPWAPAPSRRWKLSGSTFISCCRSGIAAEIRPRGLRNHRKIAVIDGRVGYVGSQNLVDRDFKSGIINQEMVVRATGPIVLQLQGIFVTDWFLETEQVLDDPAICPEPADTGEMLRRFCPRGRTIRGQESSG